MVYHAECSTARAIYVDSVLLNTLVTNLREPTKVEFSDISHYEYATARAFPLSRRE